MPPQSAPPVTTRPPPIQRPRQARYRATLDADLIGLHFQLTFLAPLQVNVTPRHERDSALAATCLRMQTVSYNHLTAPVRTSPPPALNLIQRSSAGRFSSINIAQRYSETTPRQRNQRRRPSVQHDTRFRQLPRSNGAGSTRLHQRLGFPPPPPMSETLRRCRDSAPAATCLGSARRPLRAPASPCHRSHHPRSPTARFSTTVADHREL